MQLAEFQVLE